MVILDVGEDGMKLSRGRRGYELRSLGTHLLWDWGTV